MKHFTKLLLAMLVAMGLVTGTVANDTNTAKHNVSILTADNSDGKITPKTIAAAFEKAGFFINDNRDMTAPWKKQIKDGTKNFDTLEFDVYNLFTIFKKDFVVKLAKKYPNIGLFSPMSMSIWTKKGTKTISISSLSTEAMAEIMGVPADDAELVAYGKLVQETLRAALPNAKEETVTYEMKQPEGPLVSTAQLAMDPDGDWEEQKEEFQAAFEQALIPAMFINAGFNDLNYDIEESGYEGYTFYDVYSICYLEVIYTVAKTHPEAGAFAPCSMYMYQKRGTNTMEIGFPSVYNWIASLGIEDKASHDILLMAQKKMEDILKELTAK
ncbi:DUF302 domain-containing protein [Sulfurovum sp. TSL1]|uniref:DUF302 domain-containing protein n=1 Tax=Sulfurovum sp. TSL1 TaxID=2826994 RepID=UPI001CC6E4A7|nr:DUF302 domain-containing protein [Sulfurovum sp. TSL1]GIT99380.1 hypothetical protein TSL1_22010 [Sulfurovum sp. TSL1]